MTAGVGGSEMGQSKDGKASDLTSVFEAVENSENTTGTEGNMSAPGASFTHVHFHVRSYCISHIGRCPGK